MQRDDEDHAAEQQEPVAVEPEPLVQGVGEQRLGRDQPGEDRAGDQRDPARVGEGDQAERDEGVEAVAAHRAEVVGVERPGHAGDDRADGERGELDVARVDRRRRRGALVGAHGEHALPQPAAPHVATSRHSSDGRSRARPSRRPGSGWLPSRPRNGPRGRGRARSRCGSGTGEPVCPPPQVGLVKPKFSIATAAASVTTARLTPRTRSADTAVSMPEHERRPACPTIGRERERRCPALTARCEIVKPDDPGQRQLHHGDLADEAGDDHQRQRHHRRRSAC